MKRFYLNRESNKQYGNTSRKEWDLVKDVILNVLQNPLFMSQSNKSVFFFFKATTRTDEIVSINVFCALWEKV